MRGMSRGAHGRSVHIEHRLIPPSPAQSIRMAHLPVGIDEPCVLARIPRRRGLRRWACYERARQINRGLQGGLLRRHRSKMILTACGPALMRICEKSAWMTCVNSTGATMPMRVAALWPFSRARRDGGAVVGQRERVDQILEKRHLGTAVHSAGTESKSTR